jgi:hypothetical protein
MGVDAVHEELADAESAVSNERIAVRPPAQVWVTAALVCLGYFIDTKIGFALTFQPHPIFPLSWRTSHWSP